MRVKVLDTINPEIPLEINKIYPIKFEKENQYIILNEDNVYCGI